MREVLSAENVHDRAGRLKLTMGYSKLCRLLSNQGFDVAIATIGLFHEVHDWNRTNLPGYLEIFLKVPMDELARRDPKKIYERARRGELRNVAGVDLEVNFPVTPDVILEYYAGLTADAAFEKLWYELQLASHI